MMENVERIKKILIFHHVCVWLGEVKLGVAIRVRVSGSCRVKS